MRPPSRPEARKEKAVLDESFPSFSSNRSKISVGVDAVAAFVAAMATYVAVRCAITI